MRERGCPLTGTGRGPALAGLATTVTGGTTDPRLLDEIDSWRDGAAKSAGQGLRLARLVAAQVWQSGRHLLGTRLLDALDDLARRHHGRDPFLDAFLDAVLARHHDRFRNQTYLALPLLQRIVEDPESGLDADQMFALLIADIVRHERHAAGERDDLDPTTRAKRLRHAERLLDAVDPTMRDGLPVEPDTRAGAWLELSVLPVSVVHDEYFFIRVLQAHEQVFTRLTGELRSATAAVRRGRLDDASTAAARAHAVFERASLLFRLVATLRAEQFHAFRTYTDGASAIQSEAYKRFELACGEPDAARLRSDAFTQVPAVAAEVAGQDSLARALADARRQGVPAAALAELDIAVAALEDAHQRWKTTHHGLARRLLGDAPGSGYTAGVPYLEACLGNRLVAVRTDHRRS